MKITEDELEFSTGRKEYAHARIVGINPDGIISYGYDGGFSVKTWTKEERKELAEYMITLWKNFGEKE